MSLQTEGFDLRDFDGRLLAPADLDAFRRYVRSWAPANLPREAPVVSDPLEQRCSRHRQLQRKLWDAGLAGITYPVEYGGLGLSRDHQRAFLAETDGLELPQTFAVSHGILIPTLLDYGTEGQKRRYIPESLRGEAMWVQLLSEPGAGSDLAACLTRATRDGKSYVLDGAKTWTTYGHVADYGIALCRTDFGRPKHSGLSMLIVPLVQSEALTIRPIRLSTGDSEFCEEFFNGLRIPTEDLLGIENDGWDVASRLMFHERNMIGGNSLHDSRSKRSDQSAGQVDEIVEVARRLELTQDPVVRQLIGEALTLKALMPHTRERINAQLVSGEMPAQAASLLKLMSANVGFRRARIGVEIAGARGVAWQSDEEPSVGLNWIWARASTIAGGTTEMQRNVIAERVLGLPREPSLDRDVPFSSVRRNC